MKMKAGGFLLFSFAFSSVLSSSEVSTFSKSISSKIIIPVTTNIPSTILTESQTKAESHDLKKRAIEMYQQSIYPVTADNKEIENVLEADKRKDNRLRFTGMRGKKTFENGYIESYPVADNEKSDILVDEKAGDKLSEGKRGSLAFHGMRGKKFEVFDKKMKPEPFDPNSLSSLRMYLSRSGLIDDMNASESDYVENVFTGQNQETWNNNIFSKMSPYSVEELREKKNGLYDNKKTLGFIGVRGKKIPGAWSQYFDYKRMPQSNFFGMKGKKTQSAFFGMRGKKSGEEGSHEIPEYAFQGNELFDKMQEKQSPNIRFRREIWSRNAKKSKNSFYGLRGKKSTDERSRSLLLSSKE